VSLRGGGALGSGLQGSDSLSERVQVPADLAEAVGPEGAPPALLEEPTLGNRVGDTPASAELLEMVRAGASFSGRERHCAFLNTRDGRFADVSTGAGFDLPEDGRAVVSTDWDHDGDQDFWVSHRSAPSLRFLENELGSKQPSLAVLLRGTRSNTDGIGARLELHGSEGAPLVRHVAAGDGFLGQSSAWTHFGLGTSGQPQLLVVRWPGGEREEFDLRAAWRTASEAQEGAPATHVRWFAREGSGRVVAAPRRSQRPQLAAAPAVGRAARDAGRRVLIDPLPLPGLTAIGPDGADLPIATEAHALLVNLWSSTCTPCLAELKEWGQVAPELRAAGLELMALCVDGLEDQALPGEEDLARAGARLEQLGFAGRAGTRWGHAQLSLLEELRLLRQLLFDRFTPLSLPTSLLLDSSGNLLALYAGRVDPEQLQADLELVGLGPAERRARAGPFAPTDGMRWLAAPPQRSLLGLLERLSRARLDAEAAELLRGHADALTRDPAFTRVTHRMGQRLLAGGEVELAEEFLRAALDSKPALATARYHLALCLEAQARLEAALTEVLEDVEKRPREAKALHLAGRLLTALGRYEESLEFLRRALAEAERGETRVLLGRSLEALDRLHEASEATRTALEAARSGD